MIKLKSQCTTNCRFRAALRCSKLNNQQCQVLTNDK
uniref:Uncharacterized protein n=1 Tax=Rhizophora mucronata TaxID=61149 RepID=A0A2P2PQR7_RHIMU